MRQTEIISFSITPTWAKKIKKAAEIEGRSLSEYIRESVRQRLATQQWKSIRRLGTATAKKYSISPEDIESIVDEFRE